MTYGNWVKRGTLVALTMVLAGCGTKTPPPQLVATLPPPPPPPVPMPVPPNQAATNLAIPATDQFGTRLTPNVNLSREQALWNFRIALNVAALGCRGTGEDQLIANYNGFLKANKKPIADSEKWVIKNLATMYGTNGIAERDKLSTRLYNYFATPPVMKQFCSTAMTLAGQAVLTTPATVHDFVTLNMAAMDKPFVDFFEAYADKGNELYQKHIFIMRQSIKREIDKFDINDSDLLSFVEVSRLMIDYSCKFFDKLMIELVVIS